MRIGHGFDAHAFGKGGVLILGGVRIPGGPGLIAHSDGDAVLHALCDALLGAAGLGDMGRYFPDTDPAFKGADSRGLLRRTREMVGELGFEPFNVDLTIIAQQPRLAPFFSGMATNIADDLSLPEDRVNLKATTTEGLGFTGRKEGIAVFAVVLLKDNAGQ